MSVLPSLSSASSDAQSAIPAFSRRSTMNPFGQSDALGLRFDLPFLSQADRAFPAILRALPGLYASRTSLMQLPENVLDRIFELAAPAIRPREARHWARTCRGLYMPVMRAALRTIEPSALSDSELRGMLRLLTRRPNLRTAVREVELEISRGQDSQVHKDAELAMLLSLLTSVKSLAVHCKVPAPELGDSLFLSAVASLRPQTFLISYPAAAVSPEDLEVAIAGTYQLIDAVASTVTELSLSVSQQVRRARW